MSDAEFNARYDASKKSAVVAYLLWFFLGIIGAHRFYLGRIGSGAILFCGFLRSLASIGFILFIPSELSCSSPSEFGGLSACFSRRAS